MFAGLQLIDRVHISYKTYNQSVISAIFAVTNMSVNVSLSNWPVKYPKMAYSHHPTGDGRPVRLCDVKVTPEVQEGFLFGHAAYAATFEPFVSGALHAFLSLQRRLQMMYTAVRFVCAQCGMLKRMTVKTKKFHHLKVIQTMYDWQANMHI